jgi:hypothetical protein
LDKRRRRREKKFFKKKKKTKKNQFYARKLSASFAHTAVVSFT